MRDDNSEAVAKDEMRLESNHEAEVIATQHDIQEKVVAEEIEDVVSFDVEDIGEQVSLNNNEIQNVEISRHESDIQDREAKVPKATEITNDDVKPKDSPEKSNEYSNDFEEDEDVDEIDEEIVVAEEEEDDVLNILDRIGADPKLQLYMTRVQETKLETKPQTEAIHQDDQMR